MPGAMDGMVEEAVATALAMANIESSVCLEAELFPWRGVWSWDLECVGLVLSF